MNAIYKVLLKSGNERYVVAQNTAEIEKILRTDKSLKLRDWHDPVNIDTIKVVGTLSGISQESLQYFQKRQD